jgi:hypothetical protein
MKAIRARNAAELPGWIRRQGVHSLAKEVRTGVETRIAEKELLPQLEAQLAKNQALSEKGVEVITGAIKKIRHEGVSMVDVRVAIRDETLFVIRKGGTLKAGGSAVSGSNAVRGLEEAATQLARKSGAKRVVLTVENFDNATWADWHFDHGYSRIDAAAFENATGFKFVADAMVHPHLFGKLIFVP